MDGLTWLIISWLVVGVLCYIMLSKIGEPQKELAVNSHASTTLASSSSCSKWNKSEQSDDWLNDLIGWLYSNFHRTPNIIQAWITAMNEAAKKISSPRNCEVLFEGFSGNKNVTKVPRVTNIRLHQEPNNHIIIKSNISVPEMNFKLITSQRTEDRLLVTNYDAKITDLYGEVEIRMACIANQIYAMACFCGRPELDIELIDKDSSPAGTVSSIIVDEMIRKCLLSAVTNVTLTEGSEHRNTTSSQSAPTNIFPVTSRKMPTRSAEASDIIVSSDYKNGSGSTTVTAPVQEIMRRISQNTQVILKIKNFIAVNQPYVVLEMDEPAQKFQTSFGLNMSPYWEESFHFNLTPASEEILFEIYEGDINDRFLGLAIVSLEEVRRSNADSTYTLKLQGRPYRNDMITGNLTVKFDFYHDPVIDSVDKNVDQTTIRTNFDQFRESTSSTKRPIYDPRGRDKKHDEDKTVKKRERSFFGELRDRLSGRRRSSRRAKSCEIPSDELDEAVSLPPSRDHSRTRFWGSQSHDSVSYGRKSERSTKSLYQHSTLLLEMRENGEKRYYLVPSAILDEPAAMKFLRQGKKLHVYNEHTFVAVKSPSGTVCEVCHQRVGRSSFTKQAYQCRDCRIVCHKQCHYKTESYCTSSNVNKLNITEDVDWAHFLKNYDMHEFISEGGV
ncbi:unnamed protein product [Thelazia callipaeda]|uniref:C2 domain-containing protein n=1 Tax=Thelazia callipaeda TaxID=103827 RepID=A0A0N5D8D5_THECL|nr:unnamed protein product [Thelazia callipaeda]